MNPKYTQLQDGFRKWLNTIGYAESTVYASTNYVRDFFFYLKTNEVGSLEMVQPEIISNYHKYLQTRKNKTKSGSLSNNYIISNINALKRFSKYLQETGKADIEIKLELQAEKANTKTILTQSEIKAFYKACDNSILGIRDRAILSIYYGCGLRSKEGQFLELSDIILDRKLVYVRKGKQYRERYVPFVQNQMTDFKLYLKECRPELTTENTKNWFLLNNKGNQTDSSFLLKRIKSLTKAAGIQKDIGLHTLRHSIATHLLQSGMKIESISQFLGHKNIDSTQRYTHLAHEND